MLPSLAQWMQGLGPEFGFLRVFQYLTFRAVMAAMTALLVGVIAGPWFIRRLTALKIGQPVRGFQTVLSVIAIDKMSQRLMKDADPSNETSKDESCPWYNQKVFDFELFEALNPDKALLKEILH